MTKTIVIVLALLFSCNVYSNPPTTTPTNTAWNPKAHTSQSKGNSESEKKENKLSAPVIEIPQPFLVSFEHGKKTEEANDYFSSEWWLVYLTGGLCAVTLGLTFFTAFLYRATVNLGRDAKESGETNVRKMEDSIREATRAASAMEDLAKASTISAASAQRTIEAMEIASERQLRAYLAIDGNQFFSHVNTTDNSIWWSIHTAWKNGGATPTNSLFLNINSRLTDEPLPDDFDFPDAEGDTIKMLVGPNAFVTASTIGIDGKALAGVRDGKKFFYIWGWAKYRDVFPDTPNRITKFCTHITSVTGDPTKSFDAITNLVEITISFYKYNNCMDEDCEYLGSFN